MRENKLVSGAVSVAVNRLLAGAIEPVDQSITVVHSAEDHLFIWNAKDSSIVVVNLSCSGENQIQTVNLADCPQHNITGLLSSKTGRWVTVYGTDGVTAVEMSRRSGEDGRYGGGDDQLLCRSIQVYRERDGRKVQKAAWHPGSEAENHLIVLTTDGVVALYLVGEHSSRHIRHVTIGGSRLSTALGETAVDFCFGSAVDDGQTSVWPIFVLCADGDVHYVLASLDHQDWTVEGPVQVLPEQEKDFSEESCSILVLGGSTGPSILAIATNTGSIRHHVMLGDPVSGQLSLHIYQKVELDLGPLNGSGSSTTNDAVFCCPVRLTADASNKSRYLVMHDSGLHQVEVPVSTDCEDLFDSELECVVEHLICTRPTVNSPAAPMLGATVTYPPAVIVCLSADHTLRTLKSRPSTLAVLSTLSRSQAANSSSQLSTLSARSQDSIEERIARIFKRDSSQPLIVSAVDSHVSPTQTLELLSQATHTLHTEYISKIVRARDELASEVKLLASKKQNQEALLNKLQASRTQLRQNAELISERYEDVKDRGSSLTARVEAVVAAVQSRVPTASDAQLKMARDLKVIKSKMEQIQISTEQLKEKEKYQRYQAENAIGPARSCCLTDGQVENIKEVLQGNSQSITDLVRMITTAKKDICL